MRVSGLDGELRLVVADQGKGFDVPTTARTGLGLVSMRERVNFVGGEIVRPFEAGPGHANRRPGAGGGRPAAIRAG